MTSAQIKTILQDNGYSTSDFLDLSKFSIIFLDQDANLYPDKKRTRFHFDFTNETLEVYTGRTKNNTFIYDKPDQPNHYISFKLIAGFIQNSKIAENGQILYRL